MSGCAGSGARDDAPSCCPIEIRQSAQSPFAHPALVPSCGTLNRYGTTIWSPLDFGLLTGKYNEGIPAGSRFDTNKDFFGGVIKGLDSAEGKAKIEQVKALASLAEAKLDCKVATLAIAWTLLNPNVSTCILGASSTKQLEENLKALEVLPKLTPEVVQQIEDILKNKPEPAAIDRPL